MKEASRELVNFLVIRNLFKTDINTFMKRACTQITDKDAFQFMETTK